MQISMVIAASLDANPNQTSLSEIVRGKLWPHHWRAKLIRPRGSTSEDVEVIAIDGMQFAYRVRHTTHGPTFDFLSLQPHGNQVDDNQFRLAIEDSPAKIVPRAELPHWAACLVDEFVKPRATDTGHSNKMSD